MTVVQILILAAVPGLLVSFVALCVMIGMVMGRIMADEGFKHKWKKWRNIVPFALFVLPTMVSFTIFSAFPEHAEVVRAVVKSETFRYSHDVILFFLAIAIPMLSLIIGIDTYGRLKGKYKS